MGRVVFFDLDKTLIDCHSSNNWLWRELKHGNITYWEAIRGLWWLLKYKLGFAQMEDSIRQAIQSFRGQKEIDVQNRISDFWEEDIQSRLRPKAKDIIKKMVKSPRKSYRNLVNLIICVGKIEETMSLMSRG